MTPDRLCWENTGHKLGRCYYMQGEMMEQHKEGVAVLSKQASRGLIEWYPISATIIVAWLKTRFWNITSYKAMHLQSSQTQR
jgi:hypothetical protein